jgi:hypothetical protein
MFLAVWICGGLDLRRCEAPGRVCSRPAGDLAEVEGTTLGRANNAVYYAVGLIALADDRLAYSREEGPVDMFGVFDREVIYAYFSNVVTQVACIVGGSSHQDTIETVWGDLDFL